MIRDRQIRMGRTMPGKRTIKASEIVRDLRSGMSDHEIMEKYRLSIRGLESIFRKLEAARAVKRSDLYGRLPAFEDTVNLATMRKLPRHFLTLALRIYEASNPANQGELLDLTVKGVGVRGLDVQAGKTTNLVIVSGGFVDLRDISLEAVCRWSRKDKDGCWAAGFEITSIAEPDLKNLQKLIRGLSLGNS